jgi:hypothetical protein
MSVRSDIIDLKKRTMLKTSRQGTFNGSPCTIYDYKHVNEVVGMILDYLDVEIQDAKPKLVEREES